MRLAAGDKLGPYEITAPIGKGGMGEVYRGTDTRLGRPVAIKVSAREFNDRFEREAHAISALNHPNICTLYDVGASPTGSGYLVMELVEGELLSTMIARGPLPLDRALSYAVQIVDALAAAHAKGVIHRDLKPGNIMITKNGVKVLDFGLAKLDTLKLRGEKLSGDSSVTIETTTEPITRAGTVLGTLYYMAPEQVEGKDTDERSDIFSFGVVLYEMITGQRPFSGDTQAAVLAAILKDPPPPMSQRQSAMPRSLERLVRKCLEKKPDDRWQSARDLKPTLELIDLDAPPPTTSSASVPVSLPSSLRKRWLWPSIGAAVLVAVAAAAAWEFWLKPAAPARATRFQVTLPENVNFSEYVSVSPDGHKLVFNATGAQSGLWIHDLDTLEWRKLPGTEGAVSPFWSPDSRFLGYGVGNDLKKIEVAGGPSQTLCTISQPVGTGTWSQDNVILFGPYRAMGPIRRVSSSGGVPTELTEPDQRLRDNYLPAFLPDGKHFLYLGAGAPEVSGIYAGSLDAKPAEQSKERILATGFAASYVDGNLFFMRDGTLMVQPFDAGKLKLLGEPVPVAEHVGTIGATGIFSVSKSGVLAYRSGANNAAGTLQATWFDRQGKVTGTFGEPGTNMGLALSPDAAHAAGRDANGGVNGDIWLLDFARGVRTRLTFRQSPGSFPIWSPDGTRIAFSAGGTPLDTIYEKAASGAGEEKELLKKPDEPKIPTSWSHDGRFLLYSTGGAPKTGADLWVLPLEGDGKPALLLGTQFNESSGSFSPDGRWIAYISNESGRPEIYVRPFIPSGLSLGEGKWQLSKDGASTSVPKWRSDGKEIFFVGAGSAMMAVDVNGSGAAFQLGTPKQLFVFPAGFGWDVTADGTRFLITVEPGRTQTTTPITVVLNWQADLKR